ncbi:hypothetical protein BH10ACT10_BH10ACT10_00360 [soil metagenome]
MQPAGREDIGWIDEMDVGRVALDSEPFNIEVHWVDVHPSLARCDYFDPQRQPVGLRDIAERGESGHASVVVAAVDGKIEVAMGSGLGTDE